MKKMLTIGFLLLSLHAMSQSISGNITDEEGVGVDYAEVMAISSTDEAVTQSTLTDEKGNFRLALSQKGDYVLRVFHFGAEAYNDSLRIDGDIRKDIVISKKIELEEVTVTATRKLIESKVDRMVFNVENSMAATGMDLTQALSMTPLLRVDETGISIVGKSGVSIMVNGKMLQLSGPDLVNYLRSLRADDVSKIEVITTPPARYEAQGNSGIINIILKKNPKLGWSGNLTSTFAQTTYAGYGNNGTLNYQSEKVSSSLRLRQFDWNARATEQIDVVGDNTILSYDQRKDMYSGLGANWSLDYQLGDRSNIGFIYDISRIDNDMNIMNTSNYLSGGELDSTLITDSEHRNPIVTQTLNTYYDLKLNDKGANMSIVGNYFSNQPDTQVDFETNSDENDSATTVRNQSFIDYQIWSGQIDFSLPFSWANVETGLKYTGFINNSDVRYLELMNQQYELNPGRSNEFEYREGNSAAYVSVSKDLNAKWSAKAGLRYEYSNIEGYSPTTDQRNTNNYGSWFPTAYLSYRPNDLNFWSLSYSKRINRPSFRTLNPFRWYSNPLSYYTGNPQLLPSFNHNLEIAYRYKGILNVSIYRQQLENGYGRTVQIFNGIERVVNWANYLDQVNYGLNASLFISPVNWLESYITANAFYSESTSSLELIDPQNGYSAYYSINNTIRVPKVSGLSLMLNFWQALPARTGNTFSRELSSLSLGVRMSLFENTLQCSLSANDILRTSVSQGEIFFADFTQFYNNYYDARRVSFSLTYNFGNNKVRGNQKRIQFDEKYRGN